MHFVLRAPRRQQCRLVDEVLQVGTGKSRCNAGKLAQFDIGVMYEKGRSVRQNYEKAVRWYRRAANQGLARAQLNLGVMCENGWGLAQDYAEAMRWYRKAAEQDLPIAERAIGALYVNGLGVPQDMAEARKWLEKAAAGGDDVAAQWLKEN